MVYRIFLIGAYVGVLVLNTITFTTGLHITNQTNQPLRIRMSTLHRNYASPLAVGQSYFFSHHPINMVVYSPRGTCSQFNDIAMNPTIFSNLIIRTKNNNPDCVVLGYTGRTRQVTSRIIPPVVFDPNYCKRGCWNPLRGTIAAENTMGVRTGLYPALPSVYGAGTYTSEPDQATT